MKNVIYYISLILLVGITSCQKDKYFLYNDVGRIQFGPVPGRLYTSGYQLSDTLKPYTFYYEDNQVTKDTVFFDIYTIGGTSSKDRSFQLEQIQVDGEENAIPNKHYIAFDNEQVTKSYVIKADSVHASVPVVLLRDASLKDITVSLKFQVVANQDFKLGQADNLWRKVQFTDRLSQPAAWNSSFTQYYLGAYSITKHKFMIDSTGKKWDEEFMTAIYSDYAQLQYWIGVCKTALIKYNNQHPGDPLKDEYGQLVIFP